MNLFTMWKAMCDPYARERAELAAMHRRLGVDFAISRALLTGAKEHLEEARKVALKAQEILAQAKRMHQRTSATIDAGSGVPIYPSRTPMKSTPIPDWESMVSD